MYLIHFPLPAANFHCSRAIVVCVPSGIELESESCRAVDAITQVFVRDMYVLKKDAPVLVLSLDV